MPMRSNSDVAKALSAYGLAPRPTQSGQSIQVSVPLTGGQGMADAVIAKRGGDWFLEVAIRPPFGEVLTTTLSFKTAEDAIGTITDFAGIQRNLLN